MSEDSKIPAVISDPLPKEQLDAHRAMVLWLFMTTIFVAISLAIVLVLTDPTLHPQQAGGANRQASVLLVVAMAGAMGGFVSCLRRLYAFDDIFPRKQYVVLFRKLDPYLIAYSTIPPLIGMIAAVAIYGMFAAELLKGPLFPAFLCADGGSGARHSRTSWATGDLRKQRTMPSPLSGASCSAFLSAISSTSSINSAARPGQDVEQPSPSTFHRVQVLRVEAADVKH